MRNKTNLSLILFVLASLIIFPIISSAQVPQTINYQGYLTDSDGNPVTTPSDTGLLITFSIYDSINPSAVALWSQLQPVVVSQGVYNVVLGGGASPQPFNLLFDTQYYLGIQIGSDVEMTPRQPLTSVPYALNTDNAESAGVSLDLDCSNCVSRSEIGFPVGEITSVLAGSGLTGGGTTGDISLQVDTSLIQNRVGNACSVGYSIRQINQDGSVVCEQDDGITSESDPTVNALAKTSLTCQSGESPQWNGTAWVCGSLATCGSGDLMYCYSGLQGTLDKGICKAGARQCTVQGVFGSCVGEVIPLSEVCDGLDNDCDEFIDEDSICGPLTFARVSVDSSGNEANYDSDNPTISADGRYVAFESSASNLVSNDTNGEADIFVHDRQAGTTIRVSIDSSGNEGNSYSYYPTISADGRNVAFQSGASNLVSNDTNGQSDVFVHDRQMGVTTRVSVDSSGNEANHYSVSPTISADGRYVAFQSGASNLVSNDTNGQADIFVRDRSTSTTTRVSVDSSGNQANGESFYTTISTDGRYVAFQSGASNLVSNDTNGQADIFVRDRQTGTTTRVSVDSSGNQVNGLISYPTISADGRYVAFQSGASNLVSNDTNGQADIFVRDRQTGVTTRVSVDSSGNQANGESFYTTISADGRYVGFESIAPNLVSNDTNRQTDIFVHDRQAGTTIRVSIDSSGNQANTQSTKPSISNDGNYVVFTSRAPNFVLYNNNWRNRIFIAQVP